MNMNVGTADRIGRAVLAIAGVALAVVMAQWPLLARVAAGGTGVYLLATALVGTCLGYRLMGASTCPRRTA